MPTQEVKRAMPCNSAAGTSSHSLPSSMRPLARRVDESWCSSSFIILNNIISKEIPMKWKNRRLRIGSVHHCHLAMVISWLAWIITYVMALRQASTRLFMVQVTARIFSLAAILQVAVALPYSTTSLTGCIRAKRSLSLQMSLGGSKTC